MVKLSTKKSLLRKDYSLLLSIVALLVFGVVMVYDVSVVLAHSTFGGKFYFLLLQALWATLGLGFLLGFSKFDYHALTKFALPFFVVSILLLFFVLLPTPFSPEVYGARRWIYINPAPLPSIPLLGRQSFQPSEVFKLALVIYLSTLLAKKELKLVPFLGLLVISFGLLMLQPDFGTGMLIIAIALSTYFVSGVSLIYFIVGMPVLLSIGMLVILSSPYRRARLFTYLTRGFTDPQGASYHINQIMIALGSGGFLGLGFGQSRQKYQYIPEVATDSIFAVIGEELGFIGVVALIFLFAFIIYKGYKIAQNAPDMLGKLMATGITTWFATQCLINLFSMVHIVPLTGVPLPLISYGGSSMIFSLAALGILLNIDKQSKL